MKVVNKILATTLLAGACLTSTFAANEDMVKQGEKIFMTKNLGNCLACHAIDGKEVNGPGSLGQVLRGLSYYPDEYLYAKIYDPYKDNPISAMPAFGKNGWLDDKQIKALVAYLKTIK